MTKTEKRFNEFIVTLLSDNCGINEQAFIKLVHLSQQLECAELVNPNGPQAAIFNAVRETEGRFYLPLDWSESNG